MRKDQKISAPEKSVIMRVGKALGFSEEFCENAILEILDNKHIEDKPPVFEMKALAEKFILDGLTLGIADKDMHIHEEDWLRLTSEVNGIDPDWFDEQLNFTIAQQNAGRDLEAFRLVVD